MGDEKGSDFPGQIDEQLKRAFQQVESSPIPDKLLSLLDQLRKQDETAPETGTGEGPEGDSK